MADSSKGQDYSDNSRQRLVFDPETGELFVETINISEKIVADQIAEDRFFGGASPDDIVSLLLLAISVYGCTNFITNSIKLWIEKEKGKRIRIKKGIYELEIYGGMSEKEIKNRIEQFKQLVSDEEIDAGDIHIHTNKYFERIDGGYHE